MTLTARATALVDRFAGWIVFAAVCATVAAATAARGLRVEHAQSKYEPPADDPVVRSITDFRARFGSHALLVAGLAFDRAIGAAEIELIRRATARVRTLPHVASVFSVADVRRIAWGTIGPRAERVIAGGSVEEPAVERLRRLVAETPIYQEGLVSADWRTAAIVVELERDVGAGREERQAERSLQVERLLQEITEGRCVVHLTGMPLLNRALQEGARHDLRLFSWVTAAFVGAVLLLLFRQWRPVVLAGIVALVSLTWTIGLLAATGTPMSASLTMVVPLILVLSVAFAVHYLAHFYGGAPDVGPRERLRAAMALVFAPSMLTGLTTAAGFLSLAATRLVSVRETGFLLAAGVLLSMLAASLLLPALLRLPAVGGRATRRLDTLPHRVTHRLADLVTRRAGLLLGAAVVVVVFCVIGITRVRFDANPVRFFSPDVPLRQSTEFVDRELGGSLPLEILVRRSRTDLDGLVPAMLRVERRLRAMPEVGFVASAADFLELAETSRPRVMPRVYDPATGRFPDRLWSRLAAEPALQGYVAEDSATLVLRIASRVRIVDAEALHGVVDRVRGVLDVEALGGASVTGLAPLLLRTQTYVVRSQIVSFLLAFVIVLPLAFPFVRSWRVGVAAVTANIVPLLIVPGVMGWLAIPMDIASIMIASIALGIIVDDTIHFLFRYQAGRAQGLSVPEAVEHTYRIVGVPMVVTSIVLAGGFLVLTPSAFQPTSTFGLLSAVTIAAAFLGDLLLLPAMLVRLVGDPRPGAVAAGG